MMRIQKLWWIGALAALAACDPWDETKGGTPRVLEVFATGGVADDGAFSAAPGVDCGVTPTPEGCPAPVVGQQAPWLIEATSHCGPNEDDTALEQLANEFIVFVKANKLLDGFTIEQTPNTCIPFGVTGETPDASWFQAIPYTAGTASTDPAAIAAETAFWYSCYYPSSATDTEGASVVFYRADGPRVWGADNTTTTDDDLPGNLASGESWFDLGAAIPVRLDDRTTYGIKGAFADKAGTQVPFAVELRILPDAGDATLEATAVGGDQTTPTLTLDWTAGVCTDAGATYTVEQLVDAEADTWAPVPGATDVTGDGDVVVNGLTYGEAYTFRIRESIEGLDTGETFVQTKAEVTQVILATPAAPTLAATGTSVAVTWIAVPGSTTAPVTEYRVQRALPGQNFIDAGTVLAPGVTFTNNGLDAGTTYRFRIVAVNANGESLPGDEESVTLVPAAPPAPTFGTVTDTSVVVNWTAVPGATGYTLQRAPAGGEFANVTTVAADTVTFTDTGLTAATAYQYRVIASNDGGDSAPGAAAPVTTAAAP